MTAITAQRRLAGPGASVRKYDVLTVLAMAGLRGGDGAIALSSSLALRLIALITSRYNWALDEASIGHEELMRLWGVSRRTVIRDVEKLRSAGLLVQTRAARRGRVGAYRLGHERLAALAEPFRHMMSSDLSERFGSPETAQPSAGQGVVVAFHRPETPAAGTLHATFRSALSNHLTEATLTRWFDPMRCETTGACMEVTAPSAFHADYVERAFGDRLRHAAASLGVERIVFQVR